MFKRNDELLFRAENALKRVVGLIIIVAIFGVIYGVNFLFVNNITQGFIVLTVAFCELLFAFLVWIFGSLFLSYLVDVKLIRNRLYCVNNAGLSEFLMEPKKKEKSAKGKGKDAKKAEKKD